MAYKSNIPLAGDLLSQSQADLFNNFQEINTFVGINHEAFNSVAPHAQGKHKQVEMPVQAAAVATDPTQWSMYVKNNTLAIPAPAIYLRPPVSAQHPAGNEIDVTTALLASPGWCRLPCGIIMKWGTGSVTASNATNTGTGVLVSGAGIPTITTLLAPVITKTGASELIVSYISFNEAAHTVTVSAVKAFSGSSTTTFNYLLLGI